MSFINFFFRFSLSGVRHALNGVRAYFGTGGIKGGVKKGFNIKRSILLTLYCRCVELQPDNLEAWMALSVSYTNESMYKQVCINFVITYTTRVNMRT